MTKMKDIDQFKDDANYYTISSLTEKASSNLTLRLMKTCVSRYLRQLLMKERTTGISPFSFRGSQVVSVRLLFSVLLR